MSAANDQWAQYKAEIESRLDFAKVYAAIQGTKPSGQGCCVGLCPFHDDQKPSFGFDTSAGTWECFAGCGKGGVLDFLMRRSGLGFKETLCGLGDELGVPRPASNGEGTGQITYDYKDETGELKFQVVRNPNKKFYQRRPDGNGDWIYDLKGVRRVLYRLPELLARPTETVYITEGEKDADRLATLGIMATTNPGGAGKWRAGYANILAGRDIVILPDNDVPGRAHADKVAGSLRGKARSVRIVELPDLPAKGDISDWLNAGGNRAQLETLVSQIPSDLPQTPAPTGVPRPVIEIADRPLRDILDAAWEAVLGANEPPQVFNSGGYLARLRDFGSGPQIELIEERTAISLLARAADWIRTRKDSSFQAKPPREAAAELIVNPHPELPAINAVITTPVFDHNWGLINKPGYHKAARLWLHLPDEGVQLEIPPSPSKEDFTWARALLLDDLLVDFPFASESDRAHAMAALLLPFARQMFEGPTPIHLLEAPTPGSGKSLLAELISTIALGSGAGCTTLTTNEEESRKKLTAILSRGASVISVDNLQGGLWSSQVAAAITAEVWEDRILGKTQMVRFANRALWLVSANNPKLSMEIARRCIRIRIDPGEEQPWKRTGFKHDPIREWVRQNRWSLVRAILILIQNWIVVGAPHAQKTLGSFEAWSRVIGGMVGSICQPGFLEDTDTFYETADQEAGEWRAFVTAWWDRYADTPVTPAVLLELAKAESLIPFAYSGATDNARLSKFGRTLSQIRDRRFGNVRAVIIKNKKRCSNDYRLVQMTGDLFNCSGERN